MASAVLATNHDHWGNSFRYAQITNPNPNFASNLQFSPIENPNPNSIRKPDRKQNPLPSPPSENDVINSEDFVTINLSDYSRTELKELERRLRAELAQVREIQSKIDTYTYNVGPEGLIKSPPRSVVKKATGKKRGSLAYPERESKRVSTKTTKNSPEMDLILRKIMARCSTILGKLMKHKHAWIFKVPVDPVELGLNDYFDIVKKPMDLGTVKDKLSKKEYRNPIDFASDVRLTFKNAMSYNPKGQDVHVMADDLLGVFEKMFNPAFHKFEAERVRLVAALGVNKRVPERIEKINENKPKSSPKLAQMSEKQQKSLPRLFNDKVKELPKDVPKLPEEKVKGLGKEMSFEEKEKLGISLQELAMEDMGDMLAILSRNSKGMAQEGDEIELDFEALDNDTLWELYTFVSSLKKVDHKNNESMAEVALDKSAKVDILEEDDVDIGEDIPVTNYPPVVIEKDTSSGSSGDSSSSSGSVTSSGSDSDEDSVQSPFVEPK